MYNISQTGAAYWDATAQSLITTNADVITWVAISLIVLGFFNYFTKSGFTRLIEKSKHSQVAIATVMGMIPGCGTALFLVPFYSKKKLSFGALMAMLIATSGDAAFILLTMEPIAYLWITMISAVTGLVVGYGLEWTGLGDWFGNKLQGGDRPEVKKITFDHHKKIDNRSRDHKAWDFIDSRIMATIFFTGVLIIFPGSIIKISFPDPSAIDSVMFQSYLTFLSNFAVVFGLIFVTYYPIRWWLNKHYEGFNLVQNIYESPAKVSGPVDEVIQDSYSDTLFIMMWVFAGTWIFNITEVGVGTEAMAGFFASGNGFTALGIAMVVALIPGCGPTVMFASLFAAGFVGMAAMTAAVIGQDGDAGFPLLTNDKPTFFVAKTLTLIPAFIVGTVMLFTWG